MRKFPIFDFLLAGVLMSLGWSLRGQFGHLEGALIPGALAAVAALQFFKKENTSPNFGLSLLLSAVGFSIGGHMAYGALVEKVLAQPDLSKNAAEISQLFVIGALWGGVGSSFLGFGLSEKPFKSPDFLVFFLIALYWFIPLGIFLQETSDKFLFATGLAAIHFYNLIYKKSWAVFWFGMAGIFGFGIAFPGAVVLFHPLRDQIIGFVGGIFLARAAVRLRTPHPNPLPRGGRGESEKETKVTPSPLWGEGRVRGLIQKLGFVFYLVFIPAVNTINVLKHWRRHAIFLPWGVLGLFLFAAVALFLNLLLILINVDREFFLKSGRRILNLSTIFFIWYLSALAIAKEVVRFGWPHWESAYTLFLIFSAFLTAVFLYNRSPASS